MKTTIVFTLLLCSTLGSFAQNKKEAVQDHAQISKGKGNLARDTRELDTFKADNQAFSDALANNDAANIVRLHKTLATSMKREIAQSEAKTNQAKREVVQSSMEKSTNRREKKHNRRTTTGTADDKRDMARDRRNTRDDRRDMRDDRSDRTEVSQRLADQRNWESQFAALNFSTSNAPAQSGAALALANNFALAMEADLREGQEELVEDKGELREDRRERRDDRRERSEGSKQ